MAHRARHRADPDADLGTRRPLATGLQMPSFGQDTDGELYIVHLGGTLHKIVTGTGGGRSIPAQLSATGCVNPGDPRKPAGG